MATEATDATIISGNFFLESFVHEPERQSLGFPSTLQVDECCSRHQITKGSNIYQMNIKKYVGVKVSYSNSSPFL